MSEGYRILVVDDAQIEFLALERMLQRIPNFRASLTWVARCAEAQAALDQDHHDLYFIDYRLGPDNGLDLIRHARRQGVTKPIIVLTGHGSAAVDEIAAEVGANDYLVKGEFDVVLLERTIRYATRNAETLAKLDQRLFECRAATLEMKTQSKLRAAAEADVLRLLRRTMSDQEAERKRIARELHDDLGQSVALFQLGLDGIARSTGDDAVLTQTAALKRIAQDISRGLHRIAWEVRPSALDTLGLGDAIGQLLEDWRPHCSLVFDLHLGIGDRRLPPDVESTLYRVVQEGITNVVRHADAQHVGVVVEIRGNDVICIIEDDGRGMAGAKLSSSQTGPRHLGLLGMRERLALVKGAMEIESIQSKGTALFVKVPLGPGST